MADQRPAAEDYPRLFNEALERTRRYGLFDGSFHPIKDRLIDKRRLQKVALATGDLVAQCCGGDPRGLGGQCFAVSMQIAQALRKSFGRYQPIITVGAVYGPGPRWFGFDLPVVEARLKGKAVNANFKEMHAWLTLPSYEIIDVTVLTTAWVAFGPARAGDVLGGIVADHPINLPPTLRYEPQYVGHDVFDALGLVEAKVIFL